MHYKACACLKARVTLALRDQSAKGLRQFLRAVASDSHREILAWVLFLTAHGAPLQWAVVAQNSCLFLAGVK